MTKQEFIAGLRAKLSDVPEREAEERISFYSEMIDDRMEEGLSEEDAVSAVGTVEDIASQIMEDIPREKHEKEKAKPKRELGVLAILLLILGSPIWLSLAVAVLAVVISVYASLWSVIVSLWAVFGSLVGTSLGGFVTSLVFFFGGKAIPGVAMLGVAVLCVGLSIFAFFGSLAATKGLVWLTRKTALWIKGLFVKKEAI